VIRRLLFLVATVGMFGVFALTIRDIFRLSDRACAGWQAEALGNCQAFARYYAEKDTVAFSVFALLLIAVLVSNFKSMSK